MQDQSNNSAKLVEEAKERLRASVQRLEAAIAKREEVFQKERTLRKQVTNDLDSHIENLEKILEGETQNA